MVLKIFVKNKLILFLFSRYGTYLIHFINSLFIAAFLGPYYLGVWGFINLIIQYLNHINFGITHAVTTLISVNKSKESYIEKVIGTSITMLIILSSFAILFFLVNHIFSFNIGSKYNFYTYAPFVVLIGVLGYFNSLFSSIFRVYGRLFEIAFQQTILPVLIFCSILIFKKEALLWGLVGANFFAFLAAFIMYVAHSPVKLQPIFDLKLFKLIQTKGWHLFIYNTSFFLIVISTRSLISGFYTVEEFGYFIFAFSLANVVLMLLQAFSFVIFPKMLNLFAKSTKEKNIEVLGKVRDAYVTISHLLIHCAIFVFPAFLYLFPQYLSSSEAFKLISLAIVLYTNSFGYSGLLIAKDYEKQLGKLAFSVLVVNILFALILIKVILVPFTSVIIATMLSYFIYVYIQGRMGRRLLDLKTDIKSVWKDIYPLRIFLPYLISLGLVLFSAPSICFLLPLLLFVIGNFRVLLSFKTVLRQIILNPNFINI